MSREVEGRAPWVSAAAHTPAQRPIRAHCAHYEYSEGAKYVCSDITCCFMFSSLDATADLSCAVLELNVGCK